MPQRKGFQGPLKRVLNSNLFQTSKERDSYSELKKTLSEGLKQKKYTSDEKTFQSGSANSKLLVLKNTETENQKVTIYIHGQKGKIHYLANQAINDFDQETDIAFTSFRGYHGNPGQPSQTGFVEDLNQMIDSLKEQGYKTENINFNLIPPNS